MDRYLLDGGAPCLPLNYCKSAYENQDSIPPRVASDSWGPRPMREPATLPWDLASWIRKITYERGFNVESGEFIGQIRLNNVVCSSITAKMTRAGYDQSTVRNELLYLIEHENFLDYILRKESERRVYIRGRPKNISPLPLEHSATIEWIRKTSMTVGFWEKSSGLFAKGTFVGQIRLYVGLLDSIPQLLKKLNVDAPVVKVRQWVTNSLLAMIQHGFIEELEVESMRRRGLKQDGWGPQQESGGSIPFRLPLLAKRNDRSPSDPVVEFDRHSETSEDSTAVRQLRRSYRNTRNESRRSNTRVMSIHNRPPSRSGATSRAGSISHFPRLRPLPQIPILPQIQHPILRTLQFNLEGAFFRYAQLYYPRLLIRNSWTTAHSTTLTRWSGEFYKACAKGKIKLVGIQDMHIITLVFDGLEELDKAYTDRTPLDVNKLSELTACAEHAMRYLDDKFGAAKVKEINVAISVACSGDIMRDFDRISVAFGDEVENLGRKRMWLANECKRLDEERKRLTEESKRLDKVEREIADGKQKRGLELARILHDNMSTEIGRLGIFGSTNRPSED